MKKILGNLLVLIVVVLVGRWLLQMYCGQRFMEHTNACHTELRIAERLRNAASNSEVDAVLQDYGACVKGKANIVDTIFFGTKTIDGTMAALRTMNEKGG